MKRLIECVCTIHSLEWNVQLMLLKIQPYQNTLYQSLCLQDTFEITPLTEQLKNVLFLYRSNQLLDLLGQLYCEHVSGSSQLIKERRKGQVCGSKYKRKIRVTDPNARREKTVLWIQILGKERKGSGDQERKGGKESIWDSNLPP